MGPYCLSEFIDRFKFKHQEELIEVFSKGNCYHFTLILLHLFPNGEILFNWLLGHFVFRCNEKIYDITGDVTQDHKQENLVNFEQLSVIDPVWHKRLMKNCGYKDDSPSFWFKHDLTIVKS